MPKTVVILATLDTKSEEAQYLSEQITSLGGSVLAPPMDAPPGRMAAVSDPVGGMFSVIALAEQPV